MMTANRSQGSSSTTTRRIVTISPAVAATHEESGLPRRTLWGAIFSNAVTVACILIAELLPPSILTPMARDLNVSEGVAGQTVAVTAIAAMFASLSISRLTRGIDRRKVLMAFSVLLVISSLMTATASGLTTLLIARTLLGAALGGFWSMSAALTMRLAQQSEISRALSIVFGGVSVAMVAAAPLGTFFGEVVGWRGVFFGVAALGLACLCWQTIAIPSLPSIDSRSTSDLFTLLRRPGVGVAMLALFCIFAGNFSYFTYMRPFYEHVTNFHAAALSAVFLGFGLANCVGTWFSGWAMRKNLGATLLLSPTILGAYAFGLIAFGSNPLTATGLTALWGFTLGCVPVGWSTWITRNFEREAESAGGLQVAVIQIANTTGAAFGGYVLDINGPAAPVLTAGVLMLMGSAFVALTLWSNSRNRKEWK